MEAVLPPVGSIAQCWGQRILLLEGVVIGSYKALGVLIRMDEAHLIFLSGLNWIGKATDQGPSSVSAGSPLNFCVSLVPLVFLVALPWFKIC